jgi:hypothetical protein
LVSARGYDLKAEGYRIKAKGDDLERQNYDLAATYADQNVFYTAASTRIKQMQADREFFKTMGSQETGIASSGFADSGSSLDIMLDSASGGALTRQVIKQQGMITEAGYQQQGDSYRNMSAAARFAVQGDLLAAEGMDEAAAGARSSSESHGIASWLNFGSAALSAVSGIASVGLAPFTGGASLALGAAATAATSGTGGLY